MDFLGISSRRIDTAHEDRVEHVVPLRALHRVLAFTGRSIDDVVNDPIVKNEVLGYYKLHKWIHRGSEVYELEQQWNKI